MKTKFIGIVGVLLLGLGGGLAVRAAASQSPAVPVVGLPLSETTAASSESFDRASKAPVLPAAAVMTVHPGTQLAFLRTRGLDDLVARLNGVNLEVVGTDEAFFVNVDRFEGTGPAELSVVQVFEDGSQLTLPLAVYATTGVDAEAAASVTPTEFTPDVRELALNWGSGEGEVGRAGGQEGETLVPTDIASLDADRIAISDPVNGRVIAVDGDGNVATIGRLPSQAFIQILEEPVSGQLIAVDPISAKAVVVEDGTPTLVPGIISALPPGLQYNIRTDGGFYVMNPADGAEYSLGTASGGGYLSEGSMRRSLVASRVSVTETEFAFQKTVNDAPMWITIPDIDHMSVLDKTTLADGTVAMLVASTADMTLTYRLVVVTAGGAVFDGKLDLGTPGFMVQRLASTDRTVHILGGTVDALTITSVDVGGLS